MSNFQCSCGCGLRLSSDFTKETVKEVMDMKQMKLKSCIEKEEKLKMKRDPMYVSLRLSTNANLMLKYLTGIHTKSNNWWNKDEISMTSGYRQRLVSEGHDAISNGVFDSLSLLKLAIDDLLERYVENYIDISNNRYKTTGKQDREDYEENKK